MPRTNTRTTLAGAVQRRAWWLLEVGSGRGSGRRPPRRPPRRGRRGRPDATARAAGPRPGPGGRRRPCGARARRSSLAAPGATHHSPGASPACRCTEPAGSVARRVHEVVEELVDAVDRQVGVDRLGPAGRQLRVPAVHRGLLGHPPLDEGDVVLLRPGPHRRGRIGRRQHLVHARPARRGTRRAGPRRRAGPAPGSRRGSSARCSTMKVQNRCTSPRWYTRSACVQPGQWVTGAVSVPSAASANAAPSARIASRYCSVVRVSGIDIGRLPLPIEAISADGWG